MAPISALAAMLEVADADALLLEVRERVLQVRVGNE